MCGVRTGSASFNKNLLNHGRQWQGRRQGRGRWRSTTLSQTTIRNIVILIRVFKDNSQVKTRRRRRWRRRRSANASIFCLQYSLDRTKQLHQVLPSKESQKNNDNRSRKLHKILTWNLQEHSMRQNAVVLRLLCSAVRIQRTIQCNARHLMFVNQRPTTSQLKGFNFLRRRLCLDLMKGSRPDPFGLSLAPLKDIKVWNKRTHTCTHLHNAWKPTFRETMKARVLIKPRTSFRRMLRLCLVVV